MLRIQIIGLAIMAALAMSAVAAGSASAEHIWLLNGKLIAKPVKIHSVGLLLLEDSGISSIEGGPVKIHCRGFDAGTVGPNGLDLIQSITLELLGTKDLIHCSYDKAGGCSGTTALALALHLPWHTSLYLEGTEVRDMIVSSGAGEPGWNVTCTNVLGGTTEDECLAPLGSTGLANILTAAMGVTATFDAKSPNANCTIGGAGKGIVRGSVTLESPSATEPLLFD
jgi:hypothetical protein